MVKHKKTIGALEKSLEIRKEHESKRRKNEKEWIDKIKGVVPFRAKKDDKFSKKDFLRHVTAYVKFAQTFSNTNIKPLPTELDRVFHSLMSSDDINLFVCDGNTKIIFSSESAFKVLGYQKKEVSGHKLSTFVSARDHPVFKSEIAKMKNDIIRSRDRNSKPFQVTCRMHNKKDARYSLVRITGTIEYRADLVTKKVAIEEPGNMHLAVRYENSPNFESAILIRGTIGLIEDPDFLTSQINHILLDMSEYRLVMKMNGDIIHACHRMVSINGYFPEDVKGRNAYEFIHPDDALMSLYAHTKTLANGEGVIVQRLLDVRKETIYLEVSGRLAVLDDDVFFLTNAIQLSEEEGKKRLQEFADKLEPHCEPRSIEKLKKQVEVIGQEKVAQLTKKLAATKIRCSESGYSLNTADNSQPCASSFSLTSTPATHSSSFMSTSVLDDIDLMPSEQSVNPSASLAFQSPSSVNSENSPYPPALPSSSSSTQSSLSLSNSSSTVLPAQPSTTISINYPAYNQQIIMRPINEHLTQNHYYQFGANQYNIVITTQTYSEQPSLFSQRVNQQIILQPTRSTRYPHYNHQNNAGSIVQTGSQNDLDINAELQRVNVNDFVHQFAADSQRDLNK